jgi:hypothetical protein
VPRRVRLLAAQVLTDVPGGISLADWPVLRPLLLQTLFGVRRGAGHRRGVPERLSQSLPALRVGEDSFLAVATGRRVAPGQPG